MLSSYGESIRSKPTPAKRKCGKFQWLYKLPSVYYSHTITSIKLSTCKRETVARSDPWTKTSAVGSLDKLLNPPCHMNLDRYKGNQKPWYFCRIYKTVARYKSSSDQNKRNFGIQAYFLMCMPSVKYKTSNDLKFYLSFGTSNTTDNNQPKKAY